MKLFSLVLALAWCRLVASTTTDDLSANTNLRGTEQRELQGGTGFYCRWWLYRGDAVNEQLGQYLYSCRSGDTPLQIDLADVGDKLTVVAPVAGAPGGLGQVDFYFDGENVHNGWYDSLNGMDVALYGGTGPRNNAWYNNFEPLATVGIHTIEARGEIWAEERWWGISPGDTFTMFSSISVEIIDTRCGEGLERSNDGECVPIVPRGTGVTGFYLYQGDHSIEVGYLLPSLEDGIEIDLAKYGQLLTVLVETDDPSKITQVIFSFDGEVVETQWAPPFLLGGGWNGWLNAFEPMAAVGEHVILIETFDENWNSLGSSSLSLTVVNTGCEDGFFQNTNGDCVPRGLTSFSLYRAGWGVQPEKLMELSMEETSYDLYVVGPQLTVVAETEDDSLTQVKFAVNGTEVNTKWSAPYTLAGDWDGSYFEYDALTMIGTHTIEIEAFDAQWHSLGAHSFVLKVSDTRCPENFPKNAEGACEQ